MLKCQKITLLERVWNKIPSGNIGSEDKVMDHIKELYGEHIANMTTASKDVFVTMKSGDEIDLIKSLAYLRLLELEIIGMA